MIKNVNYKVFRQLQCIFFALKIACTLQGKKKKKVKITLHASCKLFTELDNLSHVKRPLLLYSMMYSLVLCTSFAHTCSLSPLCLSQAQMSFCTSCLFHVVVNERVTYGLHPCQADWVTLLVKWGEVVTGVGVCGWRGQLCLVGT